MHLPLLVKFDNLPMFIDLKMHENPPDSGALNDLPEQNLCLFFNEDWVPSGHMWGPIDMVCHRKQEYFPLVTSSEKLYLDNVIHKSG